MKERIQYVCEICGTEYEKKEKAEECEAFHEKNVKVTNFEYVHNVEMPKYVEIESADGAIKATYNLVGIRGSRNAGKT